MKASLFAAALIAAGIATAPAQPLAAQATWSWALGNFDESEFEAIHPVVQAMLAQDPVGASRRWRATSGKHGKAYLESGGEHANSSEAVVRITIFTKSGEQPLFTFKYRKDTHKGWATCG